LVPPPLVTPVVLTAVLFGMRVDVRVVGDRGALPETLTVFLLPDVPLILATLQITSPTPWRWPSRFWRPG